MRKSNHSANLLNNFVRPYRKRLYFPMLLALLAMILMLGQSALLAKLFAYWLNSSSNKITPNSLGLWQILLWLVLCLLLRPLLNLLKDHLLQSLSLDIRHQLRKKLLHNLAALGPTRSYLGSDGALSTQILEQVDALDGYISRYYVQKTVATLTPVVIVVAVFWSSKFAAVLLLVTTPLVPIFMILVGTAAANKSRKQLKTLEKLSGRFLDLVRGMATLRRLNATDHALKQVSASALAYQQHTMSVLKLAFLSGTVLELFASLSIALVAVYLGLGLIGVLPWAQGVIPVPYQSALFILFLAPEFYAPLRQLGNDYHAKAEAQAAIESLQPLLNSELAKNHFSDIDSSNHSKEQLKLQKAPSLVLKNVQIMTESGRKRLNKFSMKVDNKERIGIGGDSGVGKSSLLHALLGFCPYEGQILINGKNYQNINISFLQQQIGYLAQTATLLPGSIADNLRLAKADATTIDMERVLTEVRLWQLVKNLPLGLDTPLGERGKGLSGGQQQRLSLAQLLLRETHIWLLDEPAAHLDPETAQELYQMLANISKDKTVLLVSHDLNEIDWLDRSIMLTGYNDGD